jgi:anti-sigma factor RsiW
MDHELAVNTLAAERYLLEEMPEAERLLFEEHYFSCADCAADVRIGAMMRDGARRAGSGSRLVPFRQTRPALTRSIVVPWAAAASLAAIVAYQSFVVLPASRQSGDAIALTPVTLRPATRGQEPDLTVGPSSTNVTLAVDVGSSTGGTLIYDVRAGSGAEVVSGRAPAPTSGSPLLLLIPARAFRAAGDYVLSVKSAEGGEPAEEYRFRVKTP